MSAVASGKHRIHSHTHSPRTHAAVLQPPFEQHPESTHNLPDSCVHRIRKRPTQTPFNFASVQVCQEKKGVLRRPCSFWVVLECTTTHPQNRSCFQGRQTTTRSTLNARGRAKTRKQQSLRSTVTKIQQSGPRNSNGL